MAERNLPSAQLDVPDTNVGDIISRQAAINTIDFMYKACEGSLDDFRDLLIEGFINLPSVQPTQTNTPNALEALDCVGRQAVRMIESSPDAYPEEWNDDYEKGFTDAVNSALSLPSAQPVRKKGNWIPVSELPKFVKTVDEGLEEENQVSDIVLVTNGKEVGPSELVKYWDEDEPFWVDPWFYDWPIDVHMDANEIIAWMPLPEPFKGGDQE